MSDELESALAEPNEARAKIEAARTGLAGAGRKVPEAVRAAIAKLDRIEAELRRVEATITTAGVAV